MKKIVLANGQGTDGEIFTVDNLEDAGVINNRSMDKTDSEETIVVDVNPTRADVTKWTPVKGM